MKSRNPSGFYMAWVVGNLTIVTGVLSLLIIIPLSINARRGLTHFDDYCSYLIDNSPNFSGAITQGIFIIGFGYLLLYLRKRALKKTLVQHKHTTILADFTPKNRGYLGGTVTILGLIFLVFSAVQFTHNSQVRRYCLNNPYDTTCVYDSPFPKFPCQDYQLETMFIAPNVTGFMLGFLIFPMFAGQMLVVVPHATRRDDTPSEG